MYPLVTQTTRKYGPSTVSPQLGYPPTCGKGFPLKAPLCNKTQGIGRSICFLSFSELSPIAMDDHHCYTQKHLQHIYIDVP